MFAKSGKMLRYKAEISQTGKHVRAPSLGLFVARKTPPQLPAIRGNLNSTQPVTFQCEVFLALGKLRAHAEFCRI